MKTKPSIYPLIKELEKYLPSTNGKMNRFGWKRKEKLASILKELSFRDKRVSKLSKTAIFGTINYYSKDCIKMRGFCMLMWEVRTIRNNSNRARKYQVTIKHCVVNKKDIKLKSTITCLVY